MFTYICYKYKGCDVQHQIYGLDGQENLFLYFHNLLSFVKAFQMCRWREEKKNSIIQNLYYCHLICVHMGRCILPLMWGTSQPSLCTLDGSMGCSSQCCLRWEDYSLLRLIKSTALSYWDSWCLTWAIWKWNIIEGDFLDSIYCQWRERRNSKALILSLCLRHLI